MAEQIIIGAQIYHIAPKIVTIGYDKLTIVCGYQGWISIKIKSQLINMFAGKNVMNLRVLRVMEQAYLLK